MQTWHIHIEGQVQGVGFRPFVYLLATKNKIKGWVNNTIDGVHIVFNATPILAATFKKQLLQEAPILSKITAIHFHETQQKFFDNFQIIRSHPEGVANLLLTPDFGICPACKGELYEQQNTRAGYAFITCTNCGPRYSIIHALPYDRAMTTMASFEMCENCYQEYQNPLDRRYYSQTNSCPACAIQLQLFTADEQLISDTPTDLFSKICSYWTQGKIIAIKGIGGYLLTCDAKNEEAISELRKRKHRLTKPFAVMFPDKATIEKNTLLSDKEAKALDYPISPIVLLEVPENKEIDIALSALAPNLQQVGCLLPYTPLYDLLLRKYGKPIIATSGNLSNAPIVFQDKKVVEQLGSIADYILVNNRNITIPQDDSVLKFTPFAKKKIILRRSRGLAPTYIHKALTFPVSTIVAMGAMLKSTFCFLHQKNTYISQYLGDLSDFDTQQNYEYTLAHFLQLFKTTPETILVDQHPTYPSTLIGKNLSEQKTIPIHAIQHHLAHFGAILGEHNLLHSTAPILGVIWDGTGWGEDGNIWGGEFFKYEQYHFLRCHHFDYFPFILGDKMPKEPRIAALSTCKDIQGAASFLKEKFTPREWKIYTTLLKKEQPLQTSSVGRIFDSVASLLGILDTQTYEGEAAMQLEAMALTYFKKNGLAFPSSYFKEGAHYDRIPTQSLLANIILDLQKGKPKAWIAAKFHFSLVQLVKILANKLTIKKIAFSGGVFQNGLLVDLFLYHLSPDFDVFFHRDLSPNDENISFGQLLCYQIQQHRLSL